MDEIDISKAQQDAELRRLLMAISYALPRGESARTCLDCGEPIPEQRRRAAPGCTRCIHCQGAFERMRNSR